MTKLLLCLVCAFALGAAMLQLRQQELELRYRSAWYQEQIEARQGKIWNQQLQIATYTSPSALAKTIGPELELVPASNLPGGAADWTIPRGERENRSSN
jgi:hypothetical protein